MAFSQERVWSLIQRSAASYIVDTTKDRERCIRKGNTYYHQRREMVAIGSRCEVLCILWPLEKGETRGRTSMRSISHVSLTDCNTTVE